MRGTHALTCTCTGTLHNGPLEAAGGKRAIALFSGDNDEEEEVVAGCWLLVVVIAAFIS